ncbi:hypothetical protein [Acinetobacter sp. SH20PTE14]|uniref:hypothetical protein n=1 Tax=Acinetobacter sp. SH20PTE14 TaxID=2905879 RepID=UPI001F3D941E|nr:hypothetical protein [Acinetobacter sp. SH20PTE14]UIJ77043.1 hypothetical protein LXF01_07285 [Acinetobacter sp. SH20PTE14]
MIDDLNKIKEIINNLEQIISKLKIKLPDIEVDEKVLKFYKVIMSEINLLSEIHEDIVYRAKNLIRILIMI